MTDCAIYVLWDRKQALALMEDRPDLRPGAEHYWVYPGGKVEHEESIQAAAVRECLEETGVTPLGYRRLETDSGVDFLVSPLGWRSWPYLVEQWRGDVPPRTYDHQHAPLAWRSPRLHAGEPDPYTCVVQIANALCRRLDAEGRTNPHPDAYRTGIRHGYPWDCDCHPSSS